MKKQGFIILMMFLTGSLFSQNVDVKGIVTEDNSGIPLLGVNIVNNATGDGTITDLDGNFTFKDVPINSVLTISYLGYQSKEITVLNGDFLTITMNEDSETIDEVVVIGYGSQKKRDLTGAVSIVGEETLGKLKPIKVEQALQGTISGVNVTTQSGAPGAGLDIRIRGIATNGANGPLVIIDGYQGDIGVLNPNDIESITVLKDAQAAIYGTAGANGVILVTTKSGKLNQAPQVAYNVYLGQQETSKKLSLLNATEYALLLNESYAANGMDLPYPNVSDIGQGTDWQNLVLQSQVPIISHDLSVSGGSENITYAFSGSHLYQQGIIAPEKTDFRRNTARMSIGAQITPKVKITANGIFTYIDRDAINDSGLGSVLFNALNAPPTLDPYGENGDFSLVPNTPGLGIEIINPLAQIDNTFNDYDLQKLNGHVTLDYDIFKSFRLTGRIGYNNSHSEGRSFAKEVSYGGKVFDVTRSSVSQNAINDNNYSIDVFGTYTKSFDEKHDIIFTLGTTAFKEFGNGLFATGFDVPNNDWDFADISLARGSSGEGVSDVGSYTYDERRISTFTRLQYKFKDKYLLSGMLRRDLSTRFGPNNRVAYFPSVTAGWVISDENFFSNKRVINFMKLRASYGILGNDQIGNNGYVSLLSGEATYVFDGGLANGSAVGVLANTDLQWEEAKKANLGLDVSLLENKIEMTLDFFNNVRDNLLISNIPVSGITGISAPGSGAPTINAGKVRNNGVEFSILYRDRISSAFNYNVGFNISSLNNEVLEVRNSTGFLEGGSFSVGQLAPSRMEVGQPIGYFYGYQTDGIFQNQAEVSAHPSQIDLGAEAAPGDIRFVDVNQDGKIDSDDRTYIGDPIPDYTMGLNLSFDFKSFDFAAYTFASIGNDMIRNYERTLSDVNRANYTLNRWTGEGTSTDVPRVTTAATSNNVFSDYFVEDASYVRLQSIQLGYSLLPRMIERIKLTNFRVYVGVNNLFTFSKYRGYDPGASNGAPIGGGIDFGFYPIPRTYLIGANINF